MLHRGSSDWDFCLGQALVADTRIPVREQFTNFRSVLGSKRFRLVEIHDFHGLTEWGQASKARIPHPPCQRVRSWFFLR